jgi:hypothetical protein
MSSTQNRRDRKAMARRDKDKAKEKEKPKYRWVQIPELVEYRGQKLTFFDYIVFLTDREERFIKTGPGIRCGGRVRDLFESSEDPGTGIEVGEWVKMHPDDWATLDAASETPSCGYPFLQWKIGDEVEKIEFGHRVTPFVDAIHEARDTDPDDDDEDDEGEEDSEKGKSEEDEKGEESSSDEAAAE